MPCYATERRQRLGWMPVHIDVPLDTWRHIKICAATSNPPVTQAAWLRRVLLAGEPLMTPSKAGVTEATE